MDKRYQARIEKVLHYIETNLDKRLTLQDVAAVSHFSQFHFHRIFRGVMGETLNDYIIRRRLERAINMLAFNADVSIADIALTNGFSSSANFAKAVKLHYGYTPSEIRNPAKIKDSKIGKVFSKYGKDFDPTELYPYHLADKENDEISPKALYATVEVKKLEGQLVVVLASARGYEPESLYETWDKLVTWANGHGVKEIEYKRFAFCYDNPVVTPVEKCRYEAAIVIDTAVQPKPPFKKAQIPGGKYAILHFEGQSEDTNKAQLGFYTSWLPNSGFEPDQFPMLERYLNDERKDGFVEMEIMIKLRRLS